MKINHPKLLRLIFIVFAICITGALAACTKSSGTVGKATVESPKANEAIVKVESSNWNWRLDQTEFKAGQTIRFQLAGKEGSHGFSIVGTDVNQPINAGETKDVSWTPDKPGQYTIKCVKMCGSGHSTMSTTITVK